MRANAWLKMAEAVPLQIHLLLRGVESLNDLDTTRLASATLSVSARRVIIKKTERWVAVTWKRGGAGCEVSIALPLVVLTADNLTHIRTGIPKMLNDKGWLTGGETAPDARPVREDGWSKPAIYTVIANSNEVAPHCSFKDWMMKEKELVSRARKGAYEGGPYSLWSPSEYSSYKLKDTQNPNKVMKSNDLVALVEEYMDAASSVVPPLTTLKSTRDRSYENYPYIFESLLKVIVEGDKGALRSSLVWMDITSVAASIPSYSGLERIDGAISSLFTKSEREELNLSYASILARHKRAGLAIATRKPSLRVETMMEHASRINEKAWEEWRIRWVDEILDLLYHKQESGESGMARLFSRLYRGRCLYDVSTRSWWVFDNESNCWLKGAIDPEVMRCELQNALLNKIDAIVSSPDADKDLLANLETCERGVNKKTGKGGRESIKTEMQDVLYTNDFSSLVDRHYDSFPLINCCIEVVESVGKREVVIRPHRKQDYNTRVAGVMYDPTLSWDHPDVKEVMEFYRRFISDDETRECILLWAGSLLWRGNRDRIILYLIGEGGEGKGAFLETLSCLDRFVGRIKGTAIYGNEKGAGAADTEFMALKRAALGVIEEIEGGRTGRVTEVKAISGGGPLPLRDIWKQEEDVDSTAKLLIVGNAEIHWPQDRAMEDRLCLVRCGARFSPDAPRDPALQEQQKHYLSDPLYSKKLSEKAHATMWILVEYLKKYVSLPHLPRSAKCREWTAKYWETQNIYRTFLNSSYTFVKGAYVSHNKLLADAARYFAHSNYRKEYNRDSLITFIKNELGIREKGASIDVSGYDMEKMLVYGITSEIA